MDTHFPNVMGGTPGKSEKSPWNFDCPPYDERSSSYVNAGFHHGVGKKNPIGHTSTPKQFVPTLPFGRHPTLKVDDKRMNNERLDIEE